MSDTDWANYQPYISQLEQEGIVTRTFRRLDPDRQEAVFNAILEEANRRLRGEVDIVGVEPDQLRDRLLAGFEHVLVDEYQDINTAEYELVRHIAKRKGGDEDREATILAVGDEAERARLDAAGRAGAGQLPP